MVLLIKNECSRFWESAKNDLHIVGNWAGRHKVSAMSGAVVAGAGWSCAAALMPPSCLAAMGGGVALSFLGEVWGRRKNPTRNINPLLLTKEQNVEFNKCYDRAFQGAVKSQLAFCAALSIAVAAVHVAYRLI